MFDRWNLDILYKGLGDPQYEADFKKLEELGKKAHEIVLNAAETDETALAESILTVRTDINRLVDRVGSFISLSQSVNSEDGVLIAQNARLMRLLSDMAADDAAAEKLLGKLKNPDEVIARSEIVKANEFSVREAVKNAKHLLSDEAEEIAAAMDANGASAWGNLQSFLTSTLAAEVDGKPMTLYEARNLAYSDSREERKAAYEGELKSYEKIQDSVAFALNNIKNQVTTMALKRGYESALDETLEHSRMTKQTLDAMLTAIREYLPEFRRYYRAKAKMLGYEGGLPWFEMFAPVGKSDRKFTPEQCRDYLVDCFGKLCPEMAEMMTRAFDEDWIDFFPRKGKEGGAFCAGLEDQKQARILTNYDYTFSSVDTLAHELGHAFHDMQIQNELPLNRSYPMPIAETASTFNELHLGEYALAEATREERLSLLDSTLRETAQCVVDIYSRFLFESMVFGECRDKFLMANDLNDMMLEAQKQAYGDGLDENCLNKGMWICKSHYYFSNYYNFPYAFGNLFAQGLYAMFKEEGSTFIAKYKEMLRLTGVHDLEQNAQMLGIDITTPDFWRKSLAYIKTQIDEFCEAAE